MMKVNMLSNKKQFSFKFNQKRHNPCYKDSKENAKNFLKELGNPYNQIIFDSKGTNAIEWGAYGVPESFLINNNKIIKKYIGPLNKVSIEEIELYIK